MGGGHLAPSCKFTFPWDKPYLQMHVACDPPITALKKTKTKQTKTSYLFFQLNCILIYLSYWITLNSLLSLFNLSSIMFALTEI